MHTQNQFLYLTKSENLTKLKIVKTPKVFQKSLRLFFFFA